MPKGPDKATRSFVVSAGESGRPVAAVLRGRFRLSWSEARHLVRQHQVRLGGLPCFDPARRVSQGQRVEVQGSPPPSSAPTPRNVHRPAAKHRGPLPVVRYADAHLVVVEKPAGLTTMRHPEEAAEFGARARRFLPPTLADLLPPMLAGKNSKRGATVRAVHRLDKETSGLVVFARTVEAERHLGLQFRAHTIDRCYLAVVRGKAQPGRIVSNLVPDRGDGRRGSSAYSSSGKHAVTHVRVLEDLGAFTLIECRLETGRTHQVRIHLGEQGIPLCGERVYDRPLHGKPVPDVSQAPRLALHAADLGFVHPATGKQMTWHSSLPADLAAFVARLRKKRFHH